MDNIKRKLPSRLYETKHYKYELKSANESIIEKKEVANITVSCIKEDVYHASASIHLDSLYTISNEKESITLEDALQEIVERIEMQIEENTISKLASNFDFMKGIENCFTQLKSDPKNPEYIANYQTAISTIMNPFNTPTGTPRDRIQATDYVKETEQYMAMNSRSKLE